MSIGVTGKTAGNDYDIDLNANGGTAYFFSNPGPYTITVSGGPITNVYIYLVGGGGGGGTATADTTDTGGITYGSQGGGGGGGGIINGYIIPSFTGGTFTVGAGGAIDTNGGSSIISSGGKTYTGNGGRGASGSAGGAGGTVSSTDTSLTTEKFTGGNGSSGPSEDGADGQVFTLNPLYALGPGGASGLMNGSGNSLPGNHTLSNYGGGGIGGDNNGETTPSGADPGTNGLIAIWIENQAPPSAPTTPSSLSSSSVSLSGFTVSWSGGTGATSYTYTLNGSSASPSSQTSTSATFSGLTSNTSYTVIVTAVNTGGTTNSSSFTIKTAPTTPSSLSSSSVSSSGFTVSWSGGTGATSYTYTLNGSLVSPSSQTSTSAIFSGLNPGTLYHVIVTAVNLDGNTTNSSTFDIRTSSSPAPCFLEGSKILVVSNNEDAYVPIEHLKPGTLVKTSDNSYRRIKFIGYSTVSNPGNSERIENRLYVCKKEFYPELKDDLYLTGNHSILVPRLTSEEKEKTMEILNDIYVTAGRYRLIACIDKRAEPWISEGKYTVWHLALESHKNDLNYGIYANGGLLVETACIQRLRNKSNMTFI
jgi:hypothetical protein